LGLSLYSCYTPPPHVKAGDLIISKFVTQSRREHNLFLLGSGGAFLDDLKEFDFLLSSYDKIDIDEARRLIIERSHSLLDLINSDENVQPYLNKTPFDYKDIQVIIIFVEREEPTLFVSPPFVAGVYFAHGMVRYVYYDPCTEKLETLQSEPYQRAIGILEHQRDVANLPPELR